MKAHNSKPSQPSSHVVKLICITISLLAILVYVLQLNGIVLAKPFAPSTIAGRVTNPDGQPVNAVSIGLYRYPYNFPYRVQPYPSPIRTTRTDVSGHYTFSLLNSGNYRILYRDDLRRYAREYYNDSPTFDGSAEISVFGQVITDVNVQLAIGGEIRGSILQPPNYPIQIEAYEKIAGKWTKIDHLEKYIPQIDANFAILGLPTGTFRVCARNMGEPVIYSGCFGAPDNAPSEPLYAIGPNVSVGSDITLTQGAVVKGITIPIRAHTSINPTPSGMGIGGKVTSVDNSPLIGSLVLLYRADMESVVVGTTYTSNDGTYFIPVTSVGAYKLLVLPQPQHIAEYYDDKATWQDATPIQLAQSQQITNINVQLTRSAYITGIVSLNDSSPLYANASYSLIMVYQKQESRWELTSNNTYVSPNGSYAIYGLPPGTYRLEARIRLGMEEEIATFYGGETLESASDVVIDSVTDANPNINIVFGTTQYEGSISGLVIDANTPKAGIRVELFQKVNPFGSQANSPILYVTTDAKGRYQINHLLTSEYQVRFSDPAGIYATRFYTNSILRSGAATLVIAGNRVYSDVNFALTKGGELRGVLQRYNGKPYADASGFIIWQDPTSGSFVSEAVTNFSTNEKGEFATKGIAPGTYRVYFQHPELVDRIVPYGIFDTATNTYEPTDITINGGESRQIQMVVAQPTDLQETEEPPRLDKQIHLPLLRR